jgi:hypothetical protein
MLLLLAPRSPGAYATEDQQWKRSMAIEPREAPYQK